MVHLFYFIHHILFISLFFHNPNKKPNPAPAHSNNYAILSIRFVICYFVFVIPYIYMVSFILCYCYNIYRLYILMMIFSIFFNNITKPPPCNFTPCIFQPCNCVPLYYYNIYSIIVNIPAVPLLCYCYI